MVDRRDEIQKIFDRFAGRMIAYAQKRLYGIDELYPNAADYVQDAFLRLNAKWDDPRTRENPEGWLMRVLSDRIADEVRRLKARRRILGASVAMDAFEHNESYYLGSRAENLPCGELFELCDVLERALSQEEYRLFCMRYLLGDSNGRIAQKLGIGKVAATQRLWRLQNKLKRILADEI